MTWHSHTCRCIPYNHIITITVHVCVCSGMLCSIIGTAAAEEERGRGAATES